MQGISTKKQYEIEIRRRYVFELISKGETQASIARRLQLNESVISRDLDWIREESKQNVKKYVDEVLPLEFEKTLNGLTSILRESWAIIERATDNREKIQALALAKECHALKLELLSNAAVIDEAMKFVENHNHNYNHNHNDGNNNNSNNKDTTKVNVETSAASTLNHDNDDASTDNEEETTNKIF